jgi:rubredoxin
MLLLRPRTKIALKKFSEVANDSCCPKCGDDHLI